MPTSSTRANAWITEPPRKNSARMTISTVPVVITVRLRVSLMLRLMIVRRGSRRSLRMFSRTRSQTITVSLTE